MGVHSEPRLYRKMVELLKLLNIYLNHFPKHEKYALCNNIRNTAYAVFDHITEGEKRWGTPRARTHCPTCCDW